MTHIKYPNDLGPRVPTEPNWQNEAMRQNALLHSAMMGAANAEARANKLELERDALLRVVTDNHVTLIRAEEAEAKLAKAGIVALKTILDERGPVFDAMVDAAEDADLKRVSFNAVVSRAIRAALAELEKTNG